MPWEPKHPAKPTDADYWAREDLQKEVTRADLKAKQQATEKRLMGKVTTFRAT